MLIENIGWFMLGAGLSHLIWGAVFLVPVIKRRQRERKFTDFVERVRASIKADAEAATPALSKKEISELQFRDRDGALCKVEIVIDPDIDLSEQEKLSLRDMIRGGEATVAGTLDGMLSGHKISEGAMDKVQQFVFSAKSVEEMRAIGMEPDEVVRSMLKSSGRIA